MTTETTYERAKEVDDDRPLNECPVCGSDCAPFYADPVRYRGHYPNGHWTASNDPDTAGLCKMTNDMLSARVIRRRIISEYENAHGV